jgi:hypothetical protein
MPPQLPWWDIYLGIAAFPSLAFAYLCVVYFSTEAAKLLRKH